MEDLKDAIAHAITTAKLVKDDAGRSEAGRYVALCLTSLEQAESWVARAEGQSKARDVGYPDDAQLDEAIDRGKRVMAGEAPE